MRIAVSEYQGRIAPVFDTCRRVIIFLHTPQGDSELASEDWSALPRYNRPDRLVKLSVQTVLCGGISCWMNDQIATRGMTVIPWLSGNVKDILLAYRSGTIFAPEYAMPGWTGCRARTFRAARGNVASRARCRVRKGDNRCRDTMELDH